jgi:hypothetical protein
VVVVFALDRRRREAPFEQAAATDVALVEALRVRAVQEVHAGRELLAGRLDDQVVVRAQGATRVEAPPEPVGRPGDELVEVGPVEVGAKEQPVPGCPARNVVDAVGEIAPSHSRHGDRR